MLKPTLFILAAALLVSCQSKENSVVSGSEPILVKVNTIALNGTIDEYSLLTSRADEDSIAAEKVISLKRQIMTAGHAGDSTFLNDNLTSDFTFLSQNAFFSKRDYIQQRLVRNTDSTKIKVQSLAVQLFGNVAIVSYSVNRSSGDSTVNSNWTDVYRSDAGNWKLASATKH